MQYFTRQLYINDEDAIGDEAEQDYAKEDYDVACKAYSERLDEIRDDLPKSVRKLLEEKEWDSPSLRYVDDHFYIIPAEELNFMLTNGEWMFILRYTIEELPVVEPPSEEDNAYFQTETLGILEEEWDIEDKELVHRILLSNGFIVKFKPKAFRWWKVKVETEA